MADSTIDSEKIILKDNWPGLPLVGVVPPGGFTGVTHHNVTTPAYDLGTKIQVQNILAGVVGPSVLIYLKTGTVCAGTAFAARGVVSPETNASLYIVTNDPTSMLLNTGCALAAVLLSAMGNTSYGWFWCGGVCPEEWVPGLGGTYATDDGVLAGGMITTQDLEADAIGLGAVAGVEGCIGWADAADGA